MLKIYLCEDNPKQREILSKYINNMILIDDYDIQFVKATDDPHEILELIDSERSTGLYFLDIDLSSDMNGLALAKEIRKIDSRGFIVFITTHSEMSFMTFSCFYLFFSFINFLICIDHTIQIKLLTGYISVSSMHIPDIHQRITALTRIL